MGEDCEQTSVNNKIPIFIMSKILVGRDNPKEVNIGVTVSSVAKVETEKNAEEKEELAQEAVEDEQVVAAEEGDDAPEEKEAAAKRRGKKRGKA